MEQRVICKSGMSGWRDKLQNVYHSLDDFKAWDSCYGLANRLGYRNAEDAWEDNPTIEGSTIPSDYRKVEDNEQEQQQETI